MTWLTARCGCCRGVWWRWREPVNGARRIDIRAHADQVEVPFAAPRSRDVGLKPGVMLALSRPGRFFRVWRILLDVTRSGLLGMFQPQGPFRITAVANRDLRQGQRPGKPSPLPKASVKRRARWGGGGWWCWMGRLFWHGLVTLSERRRDVNTPHGVSTVAGPKLEDGKPT